MCRLSIFICMIFAVFCTSAQLLFAEISDRVVAFIDNTAITYSELQEQYAEIVKITPNSTQEEVLNTMINRMLLIGEAEKIKLEAPSEDALLKEYIDLKIRAFIRVSEEELRTFYDQHVQEFQAREFDDVREEIEIYLTEQEVNERLKSHITELRQKYCIKIQLQ